MRMSFITCDCSACFTQKLLTSSIEIPFKAFKRTMTPLVFRRFEFSRVKYFIKHYN
eukprot:UN02656